MLKFRRRQAKKLAVIVFVSASFYIFVQNMRWTEDLQVGESDRNRYRLVNAVRENARSGDSNIDPAYKGLTEVEEAFDSGGYPIREIHGREVSKLTGNYTHVRVPRCIEYGTEWSPGEEGKPFLFMGGDLKWRQKRSRMQDFRQYHVDVWISDEIAVHRKLRDFRTERCQALTYTDLPVASVVIAFHNEAWTTLLRTIFSILDRTPAQFLEEIVLVDDSSTLDHLKLPLEKLLKPLETVRLVRAKRRLGLAQARNLGYLYTRGDVIIFMDSHIECLPGWYEPLVSPIHDNPRTVTFPSLDVIDPNSFEVMEQTDSHVVGGVHLHSMLFTWFEREPPLRSTGLDRESPVMPGTVLAVSRERFSTLGLFDPYLEIWGGENIELSFKTWMCGGSVLQVTCSHVAHIYRKPFHADVPRMFRNLFRVAEVWMDHYKNYFYEKLAFSINTQGDKSDVTGRLELRQSLNCQNFEWYLKEVNPELERSIDQYSIYFGQVRNKDFNLCLDATLKLVVPEVLPCNLSTFSQAWMLRTDGRLSVFGSYLVAHQRSNPTQGYKIYTVPDVSLWAVGRDPNHQWDYDMHQRLVHRGSGLCLAVKKLTTIFPLLLVACTDETRARRWIFQTRKEMYREYQHKFDLKLDIDAVW